MKEIVIRFTNLKKEQSKDYKYKYFTDISEVLTNIIKDKEKWLNESN